MALIQNKRVHHAYAIEKKFVDSIKLQDRKV